jgi:DNA-binding beta-propeller fold protein YncE
MLREIVVGETPHGLAVTPDQRTAFTMTENLRSDQVGELVTIDTGTGRITHRLDLDGRPNEGKVTPDGRFLYLPDHNNGKWWIIDIDPYPRNGPVHQQIVGTIVTGGRPHNTMTDGRYMYLGPMEHSYTYIVDPLLGHQVIGAINMGEDLGPRAGRPFDVSDDGQRLYQSVDGMIGFKVADIPARRVIRTIHFPGAVHDPTDGTSRTHGTAVRPDQREVWTSWMAGGQVAVYERDSGEYRNTAVIQMPGANPDIYWVNFSPDSRYAYVALLRESKMAVVDTATKQIVTLLETGPGPKRMVHISVPIDAEASSDR